MGIMVWALFWLPLRLLPWLAPGLLPWLLWLLLLPTLRFQLRLLSVHILRVLRTAGPIKVVHLLEPVVDKVLIVAVQDAARVSVHDVKRLLLLLLVTVHLVRPGNARRGRCWRRGSVIFFVFAIALAIALSGMRYAQELAGKDAPPLSKNRSKRPPA